MTTDSDSWLFPLLAEPLVKRVCIWLLGILFTGSLGWWARRHVVSSIRFVSIEAGPLLRDHARKLIRILIVQGTQKCLYPADFARWLTNGKVNPNMSCDIQLNEREWRTFGRPISHDTPSLCTRDHCRFGPSPIMPRQIAKALPRRARQCLLLYCCVPGTGRALLGRLDSWTVEHIVFDIGAQTWPRRVPQDTGFYLLVHNWGRFYRINAEFMDEHTHRGKHLIRGRFADSFDDLRFHRCQPTPRTRESLPRNLCIGFEFAEEKPSRPPLAVEYTEAVPRSLRKHLKGLRQYPG